MNQWDNEVAHGAVAAGTSTASSTVLHVSRIRRNDGSFPDQATAVARIWVERRDAAA
jgi:hypothetical protein